MGPLAELARGASPAVGAGPLAEPSRVAGRTTAIRKRVKPRTLGGVGAPLSAIETVILRVMPTERFPTRAPQPAPQGIQGRGR